MRVMRTLPKCQVFDFYTLKTNFLENFWYKFRGGGGGGGRTLGRGTLGRERKTRMDSRSGDLQRVDSRSGDTPRVDSRSGAGEPVM